MASRAPKHLPPYALDYLREFPWVGARRIVEPFHLWLERNHLELWALTCEQIEKFLATPAKNPIGQRRGHRVELRQYVRWLGARGLVTPFDDGELKGYARRAIAEETRDYLKELAAIRRAGTLKGYRSTLGGFHDWLGARGTPLEEINRNVCLAWTQHLHEQQLHPNSRVGMLIQLRLYLDWLFERGRISASGRELILARDMPKKPQYLPRPLDAEADRVLQEQLQRLGDGGNKAALGLYIMRRTGLRIGELRILERDCVHVDHSGQAALKVPLGKMHNERMVPLDESTLKAIRKLQRTARAGAKWLLEGTGGRPMARTRYTYLLAKLARKLPNTRRVTPHQLRHTFATSLMSGGMSMPGIMKVLGHKDHKMTLRYTAISDETVGREYFEALSRVAERYALKSDPQGAALGEDPVLAITDVIRWTAKHLCFGAFERPAKLLIRRLESVRNDLEQLKADALWAAPNR